MADEDHKNITDGTSEKEVLFSEICPDKDCQFDELALERELDKEQKAMAEATAVQMKPTDSSMGLFDWMQCIVSALIFGIMLFLFIGRVVGVDGSSMYPTLEDTDRVLISNLFYTPKQGDIIVFQTDKYGDEPLVKRVIATAGQTVDIDFNAGIVYVDGVALDEDYTAAPTYSRLDFKGPVTVPAGCLFVMGDNRNESSDSRDNRIGMVDTRCVMGKVLMVLIPGKENDGTRSWSRIGSVYK